MVFRSPTVLVLGAGASYPYGFPVGKQLIDEIKDDELDSAELIALIDNGQFKYAEYTEFQNALKRAQPRSIDAFLQNRDDYLEIGKFALAMKLIRKEVRVDRTRDGEDHWYEYFIDLLGKDPQEILLNSLKIVTFNYDRSLEHFLFTVWKERFRLEDEDAKALVANFHIAHVYGSLGPLPWQADVGAGAREYSPEIDQAAVKTAVDSLHIIHEGVFQKKRADVTAVNPAKNIKANVRAYNAVFLLGYGYLPENDKMIGLTDRLNDKPIKFTHGSAYGFTTSERNALIRSRDGLRLGDGKYRTLDYLRNSEHFMEHASGREKP